MYLDCKVDIPNAPGKISFITKGTTKYVRYIKKSVDELSEILYQNQK